MNGSAGHEFKAAASKARDQSIALQDLNSDIASLRQKARILRAKYTGHPDPAIRQYADCAAKGYDGTISFLDALRNKLVGLHG